MEGAVFKYLFSALLSFCNVIFFFFSTTMSLFLVWGVVFFVLALAGLPIFFFFEAGIFGVSVFSFTSTLFRLSGFFFDGGLEA